MKYNVGDFGQASFRMNKHGCEIGFNGYGTIVDQDQKFILFVDNDGFEFVIAKSKFTFTLEPDKTAQCL